ncbi:MAG: hypothetical protein Q8M94_11995, partial [Ignavibacteria bacterium]|nr:hypothetical protein [Ignavibacteria bacterium]
RNESATDTNKEIIMDNHTVYHEHKDTKYRCVIERAATKGVLGYKVEANGDLLTGVIEQVKVLKDAAELLTEPQSIIIREVTE